MADDTAPSYQDLFPELPIAPKAAKPVAPPAFAPLKSKKTTVTFQIAVEEQKFPMKGSLGARDQRVKIIDRIQKKTDTKIETSTSRDDTLTVIVSGKPADVTDAKVELLKSLSKEAEVIFEIPVEHSGLIIGKGGEQLKQLEKQTGARIKILGDGQVRATGARDACIKAREVIEYISSEEAKRARVSLPILKAFHPLIAGYKNEVFKRIKAELGVQINVPPPHREGDEIVVAGEKEKVALAVAQINAIHEEKKRTCGELTAPVKKAQHKYVIGPKGVNLDEIMQAYGVVVEIPKADTDSETLLLRGPQQNLVLALTMIYKKANSVVQDSVVIPHWLHKHVIGRKGVNMKELRTETPETHINFPDNAEGDDTITLEGPPEQVALAKQKLSQLGNELVSRMSYVDVEIDPKYYPQLIGRGGSTISKIKADAEVMIDFPEEGGNKIHIEGPREGVAAANAQIMIHVAKLKNQREIQVPVARRLHASLIGQKGVKIKELQASFADDVTIDFPRSTAENQDVVILRGDKNSVEMAKEKLLAAVKKVEEENYTEEVSVFKLFHNQIIGKGGATINKIRDATNVRIDFPKSDDTSELITVIGKKAQVKDAIARILAIQDEIATIKEDLLAAPKGIIKSLTKVADDVREESGGVLIMFPGQGSNKTDKICLRGPEESVAKAKTRLQEICDLLTKGGDTEVVKVDAKHHRHIIGAGRSNLKEIQKESETVVVFPGKSKGEEVVIIGRKPAIARAKAMILDRVSELENIIEEVIEVLKEYHEHFFARGADFLNKIRSQCGGVSVDVPKSGSTSVKLKGGKKDVAKAKDMINTMVEEIKASVDVSVVIPNKHHRSVIGRGGANIRKVMDEFNVRVKFPERKTAQKAAPPTDGGDDASEDSGDSAADTIIVSGRPENCDKAAAALKASVPVEETMTIPQSHHSSIIGKGGVGIRKLMNTHGVFVKFPSPNSGSDDVVVRGTPPQIESFKKELAGMTEKLEAEAAEFALKNFKVELSVDPSFHQKLIGKAGAAITKFRERFDVQVDFPNRKKKDLSEDDAKKVVITGVQEKAEKAAEHMMAEVKKYESFVKITVPIAPECHQKIVGKRGETIKTLQKKYEVRVTLPRGEGQSDVTIEGPEEGCLQCRESLLDIQDEWEQELEDSYEERRYIKPSRFEEEDKKKKTPKKQNFKVRDAPWQMDSSAFPGLGGGAAQDSGKVVGPWGNQ